MLYSELYTKKIGYYHKYLPEVVQILAKREHIAFCSTPGVGEERFLLYLAYWLDQGGDFSPIVIEDNRIDKEVIRQKVSQSKKPVVLILPYFYRNVAELTKDLLELDQNFDQKLLVIIKIGPDFHDQPEKYIDLAPFISNVINLVPLNLSETKEAIQIRRDLHGWRIPLAWENKIYRLSGGLLRLTKRISAYIDKNDNIEPSNLLKYAPITVILAQLAQTYSQLTPPTLYKLGLTNKNGAIRSELLRMYIQRNTSTPLKSDLSKSLKVVFDLLFENRNKVVSSEQIDMAVHGHAGNTLWANYKLVARLKPHIKNRYRIRSIRGQGYMLTEI